jgi:hypothetical protein
VQSSPVVGGSQQWRRRSHRLRAGSSRVPAPTTTQPKVFRAMRPGAPFQHGANGSVKNRHVAPASAQVGPMPRPRPPCCSTEMKQVQRLVPREGPVAALQQEKAAAVSWFQTATNSPLLPALVTERASFMSKRDPRERRRLTPRRLLPSRAYTTPGPYEPWATAGAAHTQPRTSARASAGR